MQDKPSSAGVGAIRTPTPTTAKPALAATSVELRTGRAIRRSDLRRSDLRPAPKTARALKGSVFDRRRRRSCRDCKHCGGVGESRPRRHGRGNVPGGRIGADKLEQRLGSGRAAGTPRAAGAAGAAGRSSRRRLGVGRRNCRSRGASRAPGECRTSRTARTPGAAWTGRLIIWVSGRRRPVFCSRRVALWVACVQRLDPRRGRLARPRGCALSGVLEPARIFYRP